jgi:hypothetical protein
MANPPNPTKLNEIQLHLLNLFSKVSNKELPHLKKVLVAFYNDLAQEEGDRIWQEKGLSAEAMDELLNTHPKRMPYPKSK